ncbi:MAG: chromosome segregation protein SMC, partial [Terracidiphilus sp.]
LEQTQTQLAGIAEERAQHKSFLETAAEEARSFRSRVEQRQQEARAAAEEVFTAERQVEMNRRHVLHLLTQAGNIRNATAQAEESLAALEREGQRLESEIGQAREELRDLDMRSEEARAHFASAAEALQRLEGEISALREALEARRAEESALRRRANQLRGDLAAVTGRRDALQSLIRNHGYSSETVRRLLNPGTLAEGLAAVGTLADFLEVSGEHESVVDEFLREELNFVVVKSWVAAEQGVRLLKSGVDGRATFLIHPEAAGETPEDESHDTLCAPGLIPLRDSIRVLNGFGRSLEAILPKLRHGYLVEDSSQAMRLAARYTHAFFLTPEGECFHNATVTGGKPAREGPLALKRELREAEKQLGTLKSELAQSEAGAATLARTIEELAAQQEARAEERRLAERDTANQGAALKQMEAEAGRVRRRLDEWTAQAVRNQEACASKRISIEEKRAELNRLETEHRAAESSLEQSQAQLALMRQKREGLQQEAAQVTAELAGLEERRRGAEAAFQRIDRLHADLERRVLAIEQQRTAATAEREQRLRENAELARRGQELSATRAEALARAETLAAESVALRQRLATLDAELKKERIALEQLREERARHSSEAARLRADLEHVEASCLAEVNLDAAALRAAANIECLDGEELAAEEENCRTLRQRMEQMGPVNMMALDEYKETADRHEFLTAQRTDLMESIENTQETIKEIDQISRSRFDEAFARINENFAAVFAQLFQGGQAFLRLTDAENQAESGLDIVASPPGKKLQNVLLLSGGEKSLTALTLLLAIFRYQPSPFCALDEADAALDEANVGRFADLMRVMSKDTQFLVVTHSKRMMQTADMIYGVTMQEPGVSKVVSMRLSGREQQRATA